MGARALTTAGVPASQELAVNWDTVWGAFCLPVPEKAQAQHNFCVFSQATDGSTNDQLLWTVPDAVPKAGVINGFLTSQAGYTYKAILIAALNNVLKPYKKQVIEPNEKEFSSQLAQAHRKGEKAYHVKSFRGSKDGFLFFLSNGIFWGFKKPLEFFAFDAIESVSYTSVLQRTFNLNIAVRSAQDADIQEYEFSMVDQADFAGIDEYIRRHQLQDASMAEQRRAKKLNINGVKGKEASQEDDDGEGELQKAAREAQDLEDEEEDDENFDPGSEGESEGSGSSSDEDEEDVGGQDGEEDMDSEGDE